jgi:hypothetical protein
MTAGLFLSFNRNTRNLAGLVLLAFRPTVCKSFEHVDEAVGIVPMERIDRTGRKVDGDHQDFLAGIVFQRLGHQRRDGRAWRRGMGLRAGSQHEGESERANKPGRLKHDAILHEMGSVRLRVGCGIRSSFSLGRVAPAG